MVNCPECGVKLSKTTKLYKIYVEDAVHMLIPVDEVKCPLGHVEAVMLRVSIGNGTIMISGTGGESGKTQ